MTNELDLEPLAPDTAKEMYHQEREGDVTEQTLQAHHYRLVHCHYPRKHDEQPRGIQDRRESEIRGSPADVHRITAERVGPGRRKPRWMATVGFPDRLDRPFDDQ